ncbi:MAG: helix-hairpin-helix domain-containing protein [Desulfobacterales bacterium]
MKKAFAACLMICAFVAGICTMTWAADMVNINTATEKELMTLEKIGAGKAAEIVKYRTEHGPFASPEDLKKVKGIGDATFELNKDRIVTDLPKTEEAVTKSVKEKAEEAAEKTKGEIESSSPAADVKAAKEQAADAAKKVKTGMESAIPETKKK